MPALTPSIALPAPSSMSLCAQMKQHFSIVSQFSAIRQVATTATVGNKSTIGGRSLKVWDASAVHYSAYVFMLGRLPACAWDS